MKGKEGRSPIQQEERGEPMAYLTCTLLYDNGIHTYLPSYGASHLTEADVAANKIPRNCIGAY